MCPSPTVCDDDWTRFRCWLSGRFDQRAQVLQARARCLVRVLPDRTQTKRESVWEQLYRRDTVVREAYTLLFGSIHIAHMELQVLHLLRKLFDLRLQIVVLHNEVLVVKFAGILLGL